MSANNDGRSNSESELQNSSAEQILADVNKSDNSNAEMMQSMSGSSGNSSRTRNIYEGKNGTPIIGDGEHGLGANLRKMSADLQDMYSSHGETSTSDDGTECRVKGKNKAAQESPEATGESNEMSRGAKGNRTRADASAGESVNVNNNKRISVNVNNNKRISTNDGKKHRAKTNAGEERSRQKSKGWSTLYDEHARQTSETVQEKGSIKGKMKQKKQYSEKRKLNPTEEELRSQARKLAASPLLFRTFQQKMGDWITQNYGRLIDIFRRFDKDQSGTISYDEFFQGMTDLGAPTTKAEMYVMATTLDADNDNDIDYKEFAKLRRQYRAASGSFQKTADLPSADSPSMTQVQLLQPCSRCNVGIWEPVDEDMPRFVCLNMEWSSSKDQESCPQSFSVKVQSETSIYGVSRLVKKELGHCVMNITIYRPLEGGNNELLSPDKKLSDYGYLGTLPPDSPEEVAMMYDYEYPFLDCPLLMADLQLTRRRVDKDRDESKVTQVENRSDTDKPNIDVQ